VFSGRRRKGWEEAFLQHGLYSVVGKNCCRTLWEFGTVCHFHFSRYVLICISCLLAIWVSSFFIRSVQMFHSLKLVLVDL
jgi:hypothetical protein